MKAKKLISLILALAVVASCACVGFVNASAEGESYNEYAKLQEAIKPENNYGLAATVNEGKIIQAWNWSYNNIIANLELLAEQGFTTIQVSPPNELKMPTKNVKVCEPAIDGIAPNGWWMFYQPAGFQLNESTDNALGVKSEFVKMCEEAHKLGLKVIVDAVINHMGTDDDHVGVYDNDSVDPMDHVNPRAAEFEPELLAAKAFHSPWKDMTYVENLGQSMRQYDSTGKPLKDGAGNFVYSGSATEKDIEIDLTRNCTSGLPDLATETQLVQDTIYEYFVELMEAGADGFRFDAAKHIETTHDTYVKSDFWEDTLLKLRAKYPHKECYAYGEILNKCGDGRPFSEYTELMDVTDSSSYWAIKDSVTRKKIAGWENPLPKYPNSNFTKENVIQWNESHDTYIDGGTSSLNVQDRNKIWALTAARESITGVYFARPNDATGANREAIEKICASIVLGEANKTSWANPEVKAVNQFDNYFGDTPETTYTRSGKYAIIERGGVGATIVHIGGLAVDASFKVMGLADGKYIEAITGNEFVVSGGTLTGKIGNTGIACIYYAEDTEPVFPEVPEIESIDVSNGEYPIMDGYATIVYSDNMAWSTVNIYVWSDTNGEYAAWPGVPMKFALVNDYGQNQYVAYVPADYDHFIITNGSDQTVDKDIIGNQGYWMDAKNASGKYDLGLWDPTFYDITPATKPQETTIAEVETTVAELETTIAEVETTVIDPIETTVTVPETTVTEPIETTTAPIETTVTEPIETTVTEPVVTTTAAPVTTATEPQTTVVVDGYYVGDVNSDEKVNIKDATLIQKSIARVPGITMDYDAAFVNDDESINIKDVTEIQKFVAKLLGEDTRVGIFVQR